MKYIYITKKGSFETDDFKQIPFRKLYSLNDNPAYDDLTTGFKAWYYLGKIHRETGPAVISSDGTYYFWLYGLSYKNLNDWLRDNPNKDITFQTQMRLKYS